MRQVTQAGLDLVRHFEGFRGLRYICAAGCPTIGYGHVIRPGEEERFAGGITEAFAQDLLRADLARAEASVLRLLTVPLADGQFDALVSFAFNLGGGALERSRLRQCVLRGEHAEAVEEFLRWTRAAGRVLRGLVERRRAEATLYAQAVGVPVSFQMD